MQMLVAFSVTPIGVGEDVAEYVADAVRVVRESGLPNRTDAMFTTVEGDWDEVMDVVRRAVDAVAAKAPRVGLSLKADLRPGVTGALDSKVEAVERYLGGGGALRWGPPGGGSPIPPVPRRTASRARARPRPRFRGQGPRALRPRHSRPTRRRGRKRPQGRGRAAPSLPWPGRAPSHRSWPARRSPGEPRARPARPSSIPVAPALCLLMSLIGPAIRQLGTCLRRTRILPSTPRRAGMISIAAPGGPTTRPPLTCAKRRIAG